MSFALLIAQEATTLGILTIQGTTVTYREPDKAVLQFDLAEAARAYARLDDVATCSREQAPELLAALGRGYRPLNEAIGHLEAAVRRMKRKHAQRRAFLLVGTSEPGTVPHIIELKKITDVKENREAILSLDPSLNEMDDTIEALTALLGLLKPKRDEVRDAWSAVKAIFGQPGGPRTPSYSGTAGDGQVGTTQGFGTVLPSTKRY